MKKYMNAGVALLLVGAVILSACKVEDGLPRGTYNVPVYVEQGGAKLVVETGGEIEVQSGATFDLQAGATTDFSSGIDLDGGALTLGADGGVILDETSDDQVSMTLGAGTGDFTTLVGNFNVGNGTPTETQNGEDTYLESILEVDGAAYFDGAIDADSTSDFAGTATFSKGSGNAIVVSSGGAIDANGNVDIAGAVTLTQTNSAGAGANPFDYTATLGAMTSDTFELFDINITSADHTGSNVLTVMDIANITGDNETTESAFVVGTGWDNALDTNGTQIVLGADGGVNLDESSDDQVAVTMGAGTGDFKILTGNFNVGNGTPTETQDGEDTFLESILEVDGLAYFDGAVDMDSNLDIAGAVTLTQTNSAGASANPFDWTATLGAMDGGDTFVLFDLNPTNADHSGGTATMLDIGSITGDNEATENAIAIGSGYDHDLNATTSLDVSVDGIAVAVVKDPAAANSNTTNEMVEIKGTTPADAQDTNVHNFLTIDAAIGDASAGTNSVRGLQIDGITGDAQVTETGVNIDTGWDVGLDVNGQPIYLGGDGGVTLDETSDDKLALGFGAGTGVISITTGSLAVGNGAPSESQNGEDVYIESMLEVDGSAYFDGAVDMDSTLDVAGNVSDGGGDFTVADNAVITGTADLQGAVDFDALIVPSFADETITDGEVLTPTVMVYALDSAGAVTMTLAAVGSEGQLLLLIGDDANDILIADTNVRTSTGNALTINQYDVVLWVYQDSEWIEVALLTDS